ncbi:MAG: copper resistance protein CopC [Gammaproteobacteria bacterium]|nr:copper resistance protein CopC [Gammaproteobacteria bacterium]
MVSPSENPMTKLISLFTLLVTTATLAACGSAISHSPMLDSEPEVGAVLTRAPRTLRLYFEDLPDVDRSALRLVGPNGEHQLRGMHTMAADDLMIEILDPLTPGDYTVEWTTVIADDLTVYSGKFDFTVQERP